MINWHYSKLQHLYNPRTLRHCFSVSTLHRKRYSNLRSATSTVMTASTRVWHISVLQWSTQLQVVTKTELNLYCEHTSL